MFEPSPHRVPHDFYATPPEGTRALLSVERFDGPIWEPACGDGGIARVLTAARYHVTSTDLIYRGYGVGGINFLAETTNRARHIVTNPPYGRGLTDQFIRHALRLAMPVNGSVAMLVDLAGLAHPIRTGLYTANPPAAVYVLDELLCRPHGRIPTFAAEQRFCWVVWKPGHVGKASMGWLSPGRFKDRPA